LSSMNTINWALGLERGPQYSSTLKSFKEDGECAKTMRCRRRVLNVSIKGLTLGLICVSIVLSVGSLGGQKKKTWKR
jgi:hypothetical protein